MIDITQKKTTRREATATGSIRLPAEAFTRLKERRLEKGDGFEIARIAAILAVKKTPELIPLCHPLPIEKVEVFFALEEPQQKVTVKVVVVAEAKTGVEMEALQGAAQALLTLYDLCKPHGQEILIEEIYLIRKLGGKSGEYVSRRFNHQ